MDNGDGTGDNMHDADNLGSVGSVEAPTPDSKTSGADSDDHDQVHLSSAELSLSSPPVPTHSDYILPPHHGPPPPGPHHRPSHDLFRAHHAAAALSQPPRNSPIHPNNPLSVERLTMSHCPPNPSLRTGSIITSSSCTTQLTQSAPNSVDIPMPQLPTPPSTDSNVMLTVA